MAATLTHADTVDYRHIGDQDYRPIGFFDSRGLIEELPRPALFADALTIAAGLHAGGLRRHDRVILLLPTGADHLAAMLACLLTGMAPCTVAVPHKPGDLASAGVRHLHAAITAVQPAAVITGDVPTAVPSGVRTISVAALRSHGGLDPDTLAAAEPGDAHHIQLTSGSTSAPKAVVLTHANVAAHLALLGAVTGMRPGRDSNFVWLPLYHDMGLVQVLLTLTRGVGLDLMTPVGFVRDPLSWLRHMTRRGTTITAAPPFAYRAAADRATRQPDPGVNLSALRQAYVGAEPIPVTVLQHFHDTFTGHGLAPDTLVPCYGMAETVLAVTLATDSTTAPTTSFGRVRSREFDRASLDERRIAAPSVPGRPSRAIVSCGTTVAGLSVRITGDDGRELGEGQIGTIHVKGSSVMAGYLRDGHLDAPPGGWHDTGDLGLRLDGELYVVGRTKEMLIVRGRNLPPYDVEQVIEEQPRIEAAAVFSHPAEDKGTEPIVAVAETRAPTPDWPQLRASITTAVREVFGLSLTDVIFVSRGGIPRTSSGKRQRAALRNDYLAGRLT